MPEITERLRDYPAVAMLGARQVGKSTLAKVIAGTYPKSMYLDLERESDLAKLHNPEVFFKQFQDHLICLDEIQRLPEIFPLLRSEIDRKGTNAQFLVLGSASRDLIQQSSQSLAGRLSYMEITPFNCQEIDDQSKHWLRGGYPPSYLSRSEQSSLLWREDYIRSFLERDIPQLGFRVPAANLGRFWRMLAHSHGQTLNSSKLGDSMGVSSHTIKNYVDILEQTFVIRLLQPYSTNVKKRLVKSPKVYIRDSGILHGLLEIEKHEDLFSHPIYGASYEGYVVENIMSLLPRWRGYFYRTSNGAEIDLLLERGQRRIGVEIKSGSAPKLSKGFYSACEDCRVTHPFVVANVDTSFELKGGARVFNLKGLIEHIRTL